MILSALATTIVFIGLLVSLVRDRSLLLKPSIIVLAFYHLCIQWPATLYSLFGPNLDYVAKRGLDSFYLEWAVPWGWHFFLLAQVFPVVGLFTSLYFFRGCAQEQWERIAHKQTSFPRTFLGILGILIIGVLGYYLSVVPFNKTGLYAIIYSPENYAVARENSLKLLNDKTLQYLYSWMTSSLVPFFCALASFAAWDCIQRRKFFCMLLFFFFIIAGILAASLTGAKWSPAFVIFVLILAWLFRKRMHFNVLIVFGALFLILGLPVVITIIRSPALPWMDSVWLMVHRTFFAPMEAGRDYVRYSMEAGYSGIAAYPKLAKLAEVLPIDLPNVIHRYNYKYSLPSGSHTASFVFFNYAAFGWASIFVSWVALWALDALVLVYRFIRNPELLLVCVSVVTAASTSFISSDYMVTLVTHGLLFSLGLAVFLDRVGVLWPKR